MVRVNVSSYEGAPPKEGESRKISATEPLYPKTVVLALLSKAKEGLKNEDEQPLVQYFTKRCTRDVANLEWDLEDLIHFLMEVIEHGKYNDSEWCDGSNERHIAACDSYQYIKKDVWQQKARIYMDEDTYIKFAISKSGLLMLLVSCHPSGALK